MLFVGCLMLGVGFGFLFGELLAGVFIGLGAGFILDALVGDARRRRVARQDRQELP